MQVMIKSMTGYGKGTASLSTGNLTLEIRTLNSKSCDVNIKSSLIPKDKDLDVRKKIADALSRGTIDVLLNFEASMEQSARKIDAAVVRSYLSQIEAIAGENNIPATDSSILGSVLRFPDIFSDVRADIIPEEEWPLVDKALDEALKGVNDYRAREGEALYKDVSSRVALILELEKEVEAHEGERKETVSQKILAAASELGISLDKERYEQEMIFYLEKFDINEEKVRLRQHCKYFMETLNGEENPGKKLGFIIQEMGREINTTGSKANNAEIQKAVVKMKDELEKIREQSMNIL